MRHVISKEDFKLFNLLLQVPGTDTTDVLATITVKFTDGCEADIKICDGDARWIDAVLFDENGHQISVLEPSDSLLGNYTFDSEHTVDFVLE